MAVNQIKRLSYTAVFEPAEEGGYTVTVPALPGCVTEGDSLEEARSMVEDAIQGYIESLMKDHDPLPADKPVKSNYHQEKISVSLVAV